MRSWKRTHFSWIALFVLAAACSDVGTAPPDRAISRSTLEAALTPSVASTLNPNGKFNVSAAKAEPYAQITADTAEKIAVAAARQFGPLIRRALESTRGAAIDFDALGVDAIYYATTPHDPTPADAHPSTQKYYGPYYFVVLVDQVSTPALVVLVSARNTDISFFADGKLRLPSSGGSSFWLHAIPARLAAGLVSPERAAVHIAAQSGRLVTDVPELVLPAARNPKLHARWRMKLDAPITTSIRGTSQLQHTNEIYVGLFDDLWVPAQSQPASAPLEGYHPPHSITRKPSIPVAFQLIDIKQ